MERSIGFPDIFARMRGSNAHVESRSKIGKPESAGLISGASISSRRYPDASKENPSDALKKRKSGFPCKWRKEHFRVFSRGCLTTTTLYLRPDMF